MFAKNQADQVPCAGCRNTSHLTPPYGRCVKEAPLSCKQIKKGEVCFGPVYEAANPEYRYGVVVFSVDSTYPLELLVEPVRHFKFPFHEVD